METDGDPSVFSIIFNPVVNNSQFLNFTFFHLVQIIMWQYDNLASAYYSLQLGDFTNITTTL